MRDTMVFKSATKVPRVLHATPHAPHSYVAVTRYCCPQQFDIIIHICYYDAFVFYTGQLFWSDFKSGCDLHKTFLHYWSIISYRPDALPVIKLTSLTAHVLEVFTRFSLHCALVSGAVYCKSVLSVCLWVCLGRAGGREVSEP